jgi:endonuclease/exonuclease/phosphatase family metal-dependent hydrolase
LNIVQIEILNNELNYPYSNFSKAETRTKQKGIELAFPVEHGLGVLSKYPIKNIKVHVLKQNKEDKEKRIAVTYTFSINDREESITNVHFSNRDDWSMDHFKETLFVTNAKSHIVGDFNIHSKIFKTLQEMYESTYQSSYDYKEYVSFPTEEDTFDYALILKPSSLENVVCSEEEVSDHRMLTLVIRQESR